MLPGWLADLLGRIRALVRRDAMETELSEEIRFHLEMETAANIRRGMAPYEARRAAALAFGPLERAREEHRDARGMAGLGVATDLGAEVQGEGIPRVLHEGAALPMWR